MVTTSSGNTHLLAFVVDAKQENLMSIHLDLAGLDYLVSQLSHVRKKLVENQVEHFHMFSEEWGDGSLSISTMGDVEGDGKPIHQINTYGWTDDWVEKHGFIRS